MKLSQASRLGPIPEHYAPIMIRLVSELRDYEYQFMGSEYSELIVANPQRAAAVYWAEIISRAHIAACTSLLRLARWWGQIDYGVEASNFFAFASGLRGFIEASGDAAYTLTAVPATLARDAGYIRQSLAGRAKTMMVNGELEGLLLHHSHASKRYAAAGPKQKALHSQSYLETLRGAEYENLRDCYAELCETVHPAADSVLIFLEPLTEDGGSIKLVSTADDAHIQHIIEMYSDGISHVWELGINMALLTLRVINRIGPPNLRVEYIEELDLSGIPSWKRMEPVL
jgi:hypothetical protein